jgi:CDP-diacylglycerol--glycerol-3-phosphate 3-phosphatidyltransferase
MSLSTLPIAITIARMAAGPVVTALGLWAWTSPQREATVIWLAAAGLFVVAALTDWLDGYLARRLGAVSKLGAALDHGADKVLTASALFALAPGASTDLVIAAVILVARDLAIGGIREGFAAEGKAPAVSALGKWKTALVLTGIAALLLGRWAAAGEVAPALWLGEAGRALVWISVVFSLVSAAGYIRALLKVTN